MTLRNLLQAGCTAGTLLSLAACGEHKTEKAKATADDASKKACVCADCPTDCIKEEVKDDDLNGDVKAWDQDPIEKVNSAKNGFTVAVDPEKTSLNVVTMTNKALTVKHTKNNDHVDLEVVQDAAGLDPNVALPDQATVFVRLNEVAGNNSLVACTSGTDENVDLQGAGQGCLLKLKRNSEGRLLGSFDLSRGNGLNETIADGKDKLENKADDAVKTGAEKVEEGKSFLERMKDRVGSFFGASETKAEGTANQAINNAGDAAAKTEDVAGNAAGSAQDAAGQMHDAAGNAADKAGDTADKVVDGAKDQAGKVIDGARDAAGSARDTAGNIVEGATDQAGKVADGARNAGHKFGDEASKAKGKANQAARDVSDTFKKDQNKLDRLGSRAARWVGQQ